MKWYAFGDYDNTVGTVNLLLDHNTTPVAAWNSEGVNSQGPTTALVQLKLDTGSWSGVEYRSDSYIFTSATINYTVDYSNSRARFITMEELAAIKSIENWNNSKLSFGAANSGLNWVYDRTSKECTYHGCLSNSDSSNEFIKGYWTATTYLSGSSILAFSVYEYGNTENSNVYNQEDSYGNMVGYGIRPVVTVKKNIFY